jgi:hypothetical protein
MYLDKVERARGKEPLEQLKRDMIVAHQKKKAAA